MLEPQVSVLYSTEGGHDAPELAVYLRSSIRSMVVFVVCVTDADPRVRAQAERSLLRFGTDAAPVLLKMIDHSNAAITNRMLTLVNGLKLDRVTLEPHLLPLLKYRPDPAFTQFRDQRCIALAGLWRSRCWST